MNTSKPTKRQGNVEAELLHAAAQRFAQVGFSAASTRAIAAGANANMALILYHFGGKDGLFDAVVRTLVADLDSRIRLALHPDLVPADRLSAVVDAFLRFAVSDMPTFTSVIARELTGESATPIAVRVHEALAPIRAHLADALEAHLEQAGIEANEALALLLGIAAAYAGMPALNLADPVSAFNAARQRARQLGLYFDRPSPSLPVIPSTAGIRLAAPTLPTDDFVD